MLDTFSGFNLSRAFLASTFIFITTADDAIWLGAVLHGKYKMLHGFAFILTLELACIITWLGCVAVSNGLISVSSLDMQQHTQDWIQFFGVVFTWLIALFFFGKYIYKRCLRKRNPQHHHQHQHPQTQFSQDNSLVSEYTPISTTSDSIPHRNQPLSIVTSGASKPSNFETIINLESQSIDGSEAFSTTSDSISYYDKDEPRLSFVILMTFTGALDEIACFPSLLIGHIFTVQELLVGCFLASLAIAIIVHSALDQCKCVLDIFDSIPLFVIVAFIAIIQTIEYASLDD